MNIREAEITDYDQIIALYRQLQPDDPVVDESKSKLHFKSIIKSKTNMLIVTEIGNSIVSSCYLNIIPNLTRNMKPYAVIENVITDVNNRNKGFGKAVVKYAINKAWKAGCYKVMLLTSRKDEAILKFYQACGLEPGIKTAFIAKKHLTSNCRNYYIKILYVLYGLYKKFSTTLSKSPIPHTMNQFITIIEAIILNGKVEITIQRLIKRLNVKTRCENYRRMAG